MPNKPIKQGFFHQKRAKFGGWGGVNALLRLLRLLRLLGGISKACRSPLNPPYYIFVYKGSPEAGEVQRLGSKV